MAQVSADIDAALPRYQEGDGRSWWATTADGEERAVRLQRFQEESVATAALLEDDRLLRLASLTGDGHVPRDQGGNKIEALVKPIGVVKGISDLPWHKDCSLGRHSSRCCSLTVGISVTGADQRSGQLGVVAGSHRALVQPAFFRDSWGLPAVPLPTSTGDVTVHCSCTLHMSHAPVARERRVMYTDFVLPPRAGDDPAPEQRGCYRSGARAGLQGGESSPVGRPSLSIRRSQARGARHSALCLALIVCRSLMTAEIDTFIDEVSVIKTNVAAASTRAVSVGDWGCSPPQRRSQVRRSPPRRRQGRFLS